MKFWVAFGSSIAPLLLCSGVLADQSALPPADAGTVSIAEQNIAAAAGAVVRVASAARAVAGLASAALSPSGEGPSIEAAQPSPAAAEPAEPEVMCAQVAPAPAAPATGKRDKRSANATRNEKHAAARRPSRLHVVKSETGTAAWYGGRYVGRRTSSGARLDTVHATAAHRSLPLNSLARVTNLRNGRSVVVRVTDRGPISKSLLIDMSPRAAEELQMKQAGLVPVRVEQIVEVPSDLK
jgi:rare lipoprotein A